MIKNQKYSSQVYKNRRDSARFRFFPPNEKCRFSTKDELYVQQKTDSVRSEHNLKMLRIQIPVCARVYRLFSKSIFEIILEPYVRNIYKRNCKLCKNLFFKTQEVNYQLIPINNIFFISADISAHVGIQILFICLFRRNSRKSSLKQKLISTKLLMLGENVCTRKMCLINLI